MRISVAWLPSRIGELWARFQEGSTGALSTRSIPVVLGLTVVIWLLEGARLYFVIRALDLPEVGLGISASVFVALAAALLTAIPLTPAGFGFVEAGIIGVLAIYGVTREPAAAVALVDRGLTIGTVIIFGGILYAFSDKVRRAHGLAGPDAVPRERPCADRSARRLALPRARYLLLIEADGARWDAAVARTHRRRLLHRWRTAHEGRR